MLIHVCCVCRPLWASLLHNLGALPPATALDILQLLQTRVLAAVPSLPAKLQAEPFGDVALSQVRIYFHGSGIRFQVQGCASPTRGPVRMPSMGGIGHRA